MCFAGGVNVYGGWHKHGFSSQSGKIGRKGPDIIRISHAFRSRKNVWWKSLRRMITGNIFEAAKCEESIWSEDESLGR